MKADPRLSTLMGATVDWQYAAQVSSSVSLDALAWARAAFQGAPRPTRAFLIIGWWMLILNGPPKSDVTHVLGWPVTQTTPQMAVLQRHSRWGIDATLLFATQQDLVTFSSAMVFTSSSGRIIWAAVAPIHRRVVRSVLGHALHVASKD